MLHDLNEFMRTHDLVEDPITLFASLAVAIYAFATIALWFVSRPYGVQRLRLACTSALVSAAAGLLLNQAIGHLWFRERPYVEHPGSLVLFTHPSRTRPSLVTMRQPRTRSRLPSCSSTVDSGWPFSLLPRRSPCLGS